MADAPTKRPLRERRWYVELRAVLVALHLFAIFLMGAPAPVGGLTKSTKTAPGVLAIFDDVSEITGAPAEDLADLTWRVVGSWLDGRNALLKPFRPYYYWCGTEQSWRMMALVNRRPARVRIELDGELAYRTGDPDARWMADVLEASRTRGVMFEWSWGSGRKNYKLMMQWLAERAKAEFGPDTTFYSCMEKVEPQLPGVPEKTLGCRWPVEL